MNAGAVESPHFSLEALCVGVYACIHKPGGAAYSNAGIIDLGGETLVVDAFDQLAAGNALRKAAEDLFERPVKTVLLTHAHGDHWTGASAFDERTTVLSTKEVRSILKAEGPEVLQMIRKPGFWEDQIKSVEKQLKKARDENIRTGLLNQIARFRYGLAEKDNFHLRTVDKVFKDTLALKGSLRSVDVRAMGWGHSKGDAAVLLPDEKIAFIGDIGFFKTQPFMGYCRLETYREQVRFFLESDYSMLVPGHGPVGGKADLQLELEYFDVLEALVGEVVSRRGTLQDALQVRLPENFRSWLAAGARRFEANVRYMYKRFQKKPASTNNLA